MRLSVLGVAYPLAPVGPGAVGGAEQILGSLDAELVRAGHRSLVLACEGSRVRGELFPVRLPPGPLDSAREETQRRFRRALEEIVASGAVDLVHFHGLDFDRYLPERCPPAIATLHLPPAWYAPGALAPRPGLQLVCVSNTQRAACPAGVQAMVIENGVALDHLRPREARHGFAVSLGRICPEKGFHLGLDAAAAAGVPLLIGGQVFDYPEHRRYFEQEVAPRLPGKARFLGPLGLESKRRVLAAARCLLVPSLVAETSSLVAMEAMACGTPVIAFPAGALAEIVEDGKTGFLVRDAAEMAAAIRRVGQLDRAACRAAAVARFSALVMAREYLQLYHRVARGQPAAGAEPWG